MPTMKDKIELSEVDREAIKEMVRQYGRRKLSEIIEMPYNTLSQKVNGFLPFSESELSLIKEIISHDFEQKRKHL